MERNSSNPKPGWIIAAVVFVFVAIILLIGGCQSYNKAGAGEINLIRNGGPLDSNSIREVRAPETGPCVCGLFSQVRSYIAGSSGRFYKVSSDPSLGSQSGYDFIRVPTKDGVNVEVDAQIQFRTNFSDEEAGLTQCKCEGKFALLLERFDTVYGNRNFANKGGDTHKVWEGNAGWNAFLDSLFRPVVENSFREQIGSVNCADLVSSCSLVQSSRQTQAVHFTAKDNQENFERIQEGVTEQLERQVPAALGDEYLHAFHVEVTKVTLPDEVQHAIDKAQSSFAEIATAKAQKIQADYQAEANERLAAAYKNNPFLAYIKAVEALKDSNAQIILGEPGAGLTVGK